MLSDRWHRKNTLSTLIDFPWALFQLFHANEYLLFGQGDYPKMLQYYSEVLRALARDMISTDPMDRPDVAEVRRRRPVPYCSLQYSHYNARLKHEDREGETTLTRSMKYV